MKLKLYVLALGLFLFSCVKDRPLENNTVPNTLKEGILMLNEGSFGNNNADFSFTDKNFTTVENKLFETANGFVIGDVMQDAKWIDDNIYATLNSSNKLVVLNTKDFKIKKEITGIISPRYILNLQDKIYVSSYGTKNIYVVNKANYNIDKQIKLDYVNSEQLILYNDYVYACVWDTACNYIYKVNIHTNAVECKIAIAGKASHSMVLDKNNKLWVLSGNKYKNTKSYLTCLNLETEKIEKQFVFDENTEPIKLRINANGDRMYYIQVNYLGTNENNGVCQMSIDATNLPSSIAIVAPHGSYYWGLDIQPVSNYIFLANPKGFTQQSEIQVFDESLQLIKTFRAGIGTNKFLFF